jgi:hypothetical protein
MNEFVVAGLLISPFVKYALIAALIFIPIRSSSLSPDFKNGSGIRCLRKQPFTFALSGGARYSTEGGSLQAVARAG